MMLPDWLWITVTVILSLLVIALIFFTYVLLAFLKLFSEAFKKVWP